MTACWSTGRPLSAASSVNRSTRRQHLRAGVHADAARLRVTQDGQLDRVERALDQREQRRRLAELEVYPVLGVVVVATNGLDELSTSTPMISANSARLSALATMSGCRSPAAGWVGLSKAGVPHQGLGRRRR